MGTIAVTNANEMCHREQQTSRILEKASKSHKKRVEVCYFPVVEHTHTAVKLFRVTGVQQSPGLFVRALRHPESQLDQVVDRKWIVSSVNGLPLSCIPYTLVGKPINGKLQPPETPFSSSPGHQFSYHFPNTMSPVTGKREDCFFPSSSL